MSKSRSIKHVHKKENCDETLESLCEALDKVNLDEPIVLKECEQEHVDVKMRNNENMPKMKPSSNASDYVGSTTKKCRRSIGEL